MTRNTEEIVRALNDRLLTFMTSTWTTRIALEGANFDRPKDVIFLESSILWNQPVLLGAFAFGGVYREWGIYQINVIRTYGQGTVEMYAVVSDVLDHFPRGSELTFGGTNVKVESSTRSGSMKDDTFLKIPVSVEFWAYADYQ